MEGMGDLTGFVVARFNYWAYIALMMIGMWAMIVKRNLVKKIIGMNIFQTAIILFYISTGAKFNATIPIIVHGHGGLSDHGIDPARYINPLPHVLMLTAIVVSVATLGVALALAIRVYQGYGTLDEDEINGRIRSGSGSGSGSGPEAESDARHEARYESGYESGSEAMAEGEAGS